MRFVLDGCDISFVAEAPSDITLEQLLKQCDKIKPDWCACGICSISNHSFVSISFVTAISIASQNPKAL